MDIIYVLIGFVCGFLCRQVILTQQMSRARAEFEKEFAIYLKRKEKQNGD